MSSDKRGDIARMGDKANTRGFPKGVSGNPGGKPSVKRSHEWACANDPEFAALAGLTVEEARGKFYALEMKIALAGPQGPKDSNWIFSMGDMMARHFGKPKEHVQMTGDVTPEAQALLAALRLTPHERRQLEAQDTTAAEDDAAMEALIDVGDGDAEISE